MSNIQSISIPATVCDDLFQGLNECHGALNLLSSYVLDNYSTANADNVYSALCLIKRHISSLRGVIDPCVTHHMVEQIGVHHAQ